MGELRKIPGVGKKIEEDLIMLGFNTIESLKNQDPQKMYDMECEMRSCHIDRCQLYVYRCAVEYASRKDPERENLRWWHFKD
jgi:hypothetical protein